MKYLLFLKMNDLHIFVHNMQVSNLMIIRGKITGEFKLSAVKTHSASN